ncbi:MAG TPA: HD domain-containing phosphohydrolase [Anaerolineales bacterium]|nr:HD domain-containing phosphohydrolase [Anaerolineales bacterium]
MENLLNVLIVEDSQDDADLIIREIQRGGYQVEWERVETRAALGSALQRKAWDLILCDHSLPQFDSLNALSVLRESGLDLPFIMVSGSLGEEAAVEVLKAGAHDYVNKGNMARLVPAIRRELAEADMRRQRRQAIEALHESERRYRGLFEDSPISVWQEDFSQAVKIVEGLRSQGTTNFREYFADHPEVVAECAAVIQVLDVNNSTLKLYEARNKDELLKGLDQILESQDSKNFVDQLIAIAEGRKEYEAEMANRTLSGKPIYVQVFWRALPQYEETMSRVIVSIVDITERKKAEEEAKTQVQRLSALRSIDVMITSSFDLNLTLDMVLQQVIAQLHVDAAAVLLLKLGSQTLEFMRGSGFHGRAIESAPLYLNEGLPARALLERKTIFVRRLSHATNLKRSFLLTDEGFVSYCAVPLISKGKMEGVLEVFHRTDLSPDAEWLQFLEALGRQAAIAADNSNLFNDLQRTGMELALAYDATIEGWSRALDLRDKETEGHTQRVTEMTLKLARAMGIDDADLVHIRRGGLLHDIGKMGVPDHILLKPGKLTEEEWIVMRQHPRFAYDLLAPIAYLRPALDIPYCHHEKWDGTGYPRGLKGEQIPFSARIFAVVDVWDALSFDRPYRPAWKPEDVLKYVREQSGSHFDPLVVDTFLKQVL